MEGGGPLGKKLLGGHPSIDLKNFFANHNRHFKVYGRVSLEFYFLVMWTMPKNIRNELILPNLP